MSVNIKYKNNSIATLTDTGTKTLKTSGKYCEADIIVENTKDGGGGGKIYVETVTFTSQTREYTINHNLGEKPNFFMAFCMNDMDNYGTELVAAISGFAKGGVLTYLFSGTGNTGSDTNAYASISNISKTDKTYTTIEPIRGYSLPVPSLVDNTTLKLGANSTTHYFMAKQYIMICAVLDMEGTE